MYWPAIRFERDGHLDLVDAFLIHFFLNRSHQETREAAMAALNLTRDFIGLQTLTLYVDRHGHTATHPDKALRRLIRSSRTTDGIHLLSDDTRLDNYEVYYYGQPLPDAIRPDFRNDFHVWLPSEFVARVGADAVADFAHALANLLPCSFDYATPALRYTDFEISAVARKRAERYPGFDVMPSGAPEVTIGERAAGAYWISILGEKLTAALGGALSLGAALPPEVIVKGLTQGKTYVRLGHEPDVGDRNRGSDLPLLRAFARLIEPQLYEPEIIYLMDETGEPDPEAVMRWHRRFLD